jgi:hypothetical protein
VSVELCGGVAQVWVRVSCLVVNVFSVECSCIASRGVSFCALASGHSRVGASSMMLPKPTCKNDLDVLMLTR